MMTPLARFQEGLLPAEEALIFSPVSRRYLTGFASSDGVLHLGKEFARLYLDSRYYEMALLAKEQGRIPAAVEIKGMVFATEFAAARTAGKTRQIYLEDLRMTHGEWRQMEVRFPDCEYLPLGRRLEEVRIVKSEEEIRKIAAAQALAEEAFQYLLPRLEAGRSEISVAAELEYYMKLHGAEGPSFSTICVSGTRSSLPHGTPTQSLLESGTFITLDFGCMLDGYASDMTRTVCLGKASDSMKKVYQTVLSAQLAGIAAVKSGVPGKAVDRAARSVIEEAGYGEYFGHSTGHGIGLEVHESPSAAPKTETALPAGSVISVEPGIYLPGTFGVRIEDLVVVREGGSENLNRTSKELLEL